MRSAWGWQRYWRGRCSRPEPTFQRLCCRSRCSWRWPWPCGAVHCRCDRPCASIQFGFSEASEMSFTFRILSASLRHQRARVGVAALAMALGSALVSGLLNLSGDVGGQVGRELRAYGANLLIRPREQSLPVGSGTLDFGVVAAAATIQAPELESAKRVSGVVGFVPYLYAVVEAAGSPAVLAGVDLAAARTLNSWWQVRGRWPEAGDEVIIGVRAAAALGLRPGDTLAVRYGGQSLDMRAVGFLETGGPEEDQLFADLPAVQLLTGQPDRVGLVMVSALTSDRPLEAVAGELRTLLPNAEVRTLGPFGRAGAKGFGQA